MQDSGTTWDFRSIPHESTSAEKVLVFFFLATVIVATVKLIKIWRIAPPFLASQQAGNQTFARQLQDSARSLSEWMKLTLLFYPLLICFDLYHECSGLLYSRSLLASDVVRLIEDASVLFEQGFLLALLLFSIRWHFLKRLADIKNYPTSE